jgi:hypothetical protein
MWVSRLLILAGMPEKAVNTPMPIFTFFAPSLLDRNGAGLTPSLALQAKAA